MNQLPEMQKSLANRLAELLAAQDMRAIVRLVSQILKPNVAGLESGAIPGSPGRRPGGPVRVGIWERSVNDGQASFVRVQTGDPWTMWANVSSIPPKSRQKRIILLGESVARGYFYDPHFNPASALRTILNFVLKPASVEVIDLARTDMTLDPLVDLAESAVLLEPDAMIFFAGNNWHYRYEEGSQDLTEIARILRDGEGAPGIHAFIAKRLRAHIECGLNRLAAISKRHSIPFLFVIPEFNLAGWRTPCYAPPILEMADTSEWLVEFEAAEFALRCGDLGKAAAAARRLIELDHGATPAGFSILAETAHRQGMLEDERDHLERARDATLSQPFIGSPRRYSLTRDILLSQAGQNGIFTVDLKHRFQEYLNGELPDQRLFVDYCHLTVEGIRLAMASAAEALLSIVFRVRRHWSELNQIKMEVSPKVVAEADFLAAIHNANYGQKTSIVRAQLDHAIQVFPDIKELMSCFMDSQLRKCPTVLCPEFEQIIEMQSPSVLRALYITPRTPKAFNSALVSAIAGALDPGDRSLQHAQSILVGEHAVNHGQVDLLHRFYCGLAATAAFREDWTSESGLPTCQPLWAGHIDTPDYTESSFAFFKARNKSSQFLLVCDSPCDMLLSLTFRISNCAAGSAVSVSVNGTRITSVVGTQHWQVQQIMIPGTVLSRGANVVEIVWPPLQWPSLRWIEELAYGFECGHLPDIRPAYGEIHNFHAAVMAAGEPQDNAATDQEVLTAKHG